MKIKIEKFDNIKVEIFVCTPPTHTHQMIRQTIDGEKRFAPYIINKGLDLTYIKNSTNYKENDNRKWPKD